MADGRRATTSPAHLRACWTPAPREQMGVPALSLRMGGFGDPERIRTADLHLDRVACLAATPRGPSSESRKRPIVGQSRRCGTSSAGGACAPGVAALVRILKMKGSSPWHEDNAAAGLRRLARAGAVPPCRAVAVASVRAGRRKTRLRPPRPVRRKRRPVAPPLVAVSRCPPPARRPSVPSDHVGDRDNP